MTLSSVAVSCQKGRSRAGVINLSWTTGYFLDITYSGGTLILKFATFRTSCSICYVLAGGVITYQLPLLQWAMSGNPRLPIFSLEPPSTFEKNFENILKQAGGHLIMPSRATWCLRAHNW